MTDDLDKDDSRAIMDVATDVRPAENVTNDKKLAEHGERAGKDLTQGESAAIHRLAMDVRPGENFHPDEAED